MFLNSHTVIKFAAVPGLEVDDDIQNGVIFDRPHAEQLPHVNHADSPKFDVVADQFRGRAGELAGETPQFYGVVGHQPMTAHDQLDRNLAFANAGVSGNHDAFSVNVQQNAVTGDAGRKDAIEAVDYAAGKGRCGLGCAEERFFMLHRAFQTAGKAVQAPGDHQGRNIVHKKVIEAFTPLGRRQTFQISDLRFADHLQAAGIKVIVKFVKLKPRPVDIGHGEPGGIKIAALVQHFQIELGNKVLEFQSMFLHGIFHPFPAR